MLARNPMTVTSLVAWLEKQPANGEYNYANSIDCMLCRYFRAHEVAFDGVNATTYWLGDQRTQLPEHFDNIARGNAGLIVDDCPEWNYGAALRRAREFA